MQRTAHHPGRTFRRRKGEKKEKELTYNNSMASCPPLSLNLDRHDQAIQASNAFAYLLYVRELTLTASSITAEQVDHFLEHGFVVVKAAFSKEKAAEWTKTMWVRMGLDPDDKTTWDRERIHMPWHKREQVSKFAPKVNASVKKNHLA
jgi:hypothetical protein